MLPGSAPWGAGRAEAQVTCLAHLPLRGSHPWLPSRALSFQRDARRAGSFLCHQAQSRRSFALRSCPAASQGRKVPSEEATESPATSLPFQVALTAGGGCPRGMLRSLPATSGTRDRTHVQTVREAGLNSAHNRASPSLTHSFDPRPCRSHPTLTTSRGGQGVRLLHRSSLPPSRTQLCISLCALPLVSPHAVCSWQMPAVTVLLCPFRCFFIPSPNHCLSPRGREVGGTAKPIRMQHSQQIKQCTVLLPSREFIRHQYLDTSFQRQTL